jgi:hypothetical protein
MILVEGSQAFPVRLSDGGLHEKLNSPGVKARQGGDADHSPPSSAEVENE